MIWPIMGSAASFSAGVVPELSASVQNFGVFSRRRMVGCRPCEVGIVRCWTFQGSVTGQWGADGTAAEVWGAAGLDGIPIEVLLRDQRAVAQQGHGSVVL